MRLPVLETNERINRDLTARVRGEVRGSHVDRAMYAVDGSLYEVEPLLVVAPRDVDDVVSVVEYANTHGLPLLARGAGTSLAGQSVNTAIVLDYSRFMNEVLEIDPDARRARVQPGVVLDQFNRALAPHGLKFGPDVSTSTHATLGGMIGNSSAGAYSLVHGMTDAHVEAMRVVRADGSRAELGLGTPPSLVAALAAIVRPLEQEIDAKFPKVMRNTGGYRLDDVLAQLRQSTPETNDAVNLAQFLAGSEGTLALMSEATVRIVERPTRVRLAVFGFHSVGEACAHVERLVASGAAAVELMDGTIISGAASQPVYERDVALLPRMDGELPGTVLLVEYHDDQCDGVAEGANRCVYDDAADQRRLWNVRKVGLGIISASPGPKHAIQGLEDCAVPLERLVEFQTRFVELMKAHSTDGVFYAHASVGLLHVRPRFDLRQPLERSSFHRLMDEVLAMVIELGGSISGEHGDGRIRANLMRAAYGTKICAAFDEVKALFDPAGLLNPENITAERDPFESLRREGTSVKMETYFEWPDGGPLAAAEACNANGLCRRAEDGAMCPSYRVLCDERHVTRGRAAALKAVFRGEVGWEDESAHETLDLCLSCKACKHECPSNIDVAKLKAEYTAQRYRAKGSVPASARRLARTGSLADLAARLHPLPTLALAVPGVASIAKRFLGVAPSRSLPVPGKSLARGTFGAGAKVLLFPDCFTRSFDPHIAEAAVTVLTALGYETVIPEGAHCCGRTAISAGVLDEARTQIEATAASLASHDVAAIIVLEPSCLSAIKEEWQELKTSVDRRTMAALAEKSCSLETFIAQHPRAIDVPTIETPVVVHAHCHAKLDGPVTVEALRRLGYQNVELVDSGCCGMAGSFGYMRATDGLSRAIAEDSLGKAMGSRGEAVVVAAGTSCRHQLSDCFDVAAVHPAQLAGSTIGSSP